MDSNLKIGYVLRSGITVPSATISHQIKNFNATDYIVDGQVLITTPEGYVVNTAAYNLVTNPGGTNGHPTGITKFQIRQRQGDTVYTSATIPIAAVTSYKVDAYRPELEQVTTIGFDGVSGTIISNPVSAQTYQVTVMREDDDFYMQVERPKTVQYVQGSNILLANSSALYGTALTGEPKVGEITLGLADFFYKEFIKTITGYTQVDLPIKIEVLCNGTFGNAAVSACAIAYESDIVTRVAHGLTSADEGKLIKFGANTAITPVYVIKKVLDADNFQLTVAFQGTSIASVASYIGTVPPTLWGLKIIGNRKMFATNLWKYRKTRFQVQVNTAYITGNIVSQGVAYTGVNTKGLTTPTTGYVPVGTLIPNITAYNGLGVAPLVNEMEFNLLGFHGTEKQYRLSVDRTQTNRALISDYNGTNCTYSILNLEWQKQYNEEPTYTINDSGNIIVAIPIVYDTTPTTDTIGIETNATDATYGFISVLDAILPSTLANQALNVVTY